MCETDIILYPSKNIKINYHWVISNILIIRGVISIWEYFLICITFLYVFLNKLIDELYFMCIFDPPPPPPPTPPKQKKKSNSAIIYSLSFYSETIWLSFIKAYLLKNAGKPFWTSIEKRKDLAISKDIGYQLASPPFLKASLKHVNGI